jgi:hypothetical protein
VLLTALVSLGRGPTLAEPSHEEAVYRKALDGGRILVVKRHEVPYVPTVDTEQQKQAQKEFERTHPNMKLRTIHPERMYEYTFSVTHEISNGVTTLWTQRFGWFREIGGQDVRVEDGVVEGNNLAVVFWYGSPGTPAAYVYFIQPDGRGGYKETMMCGGFTPGCAPSSYIKSFRFFGSIEVGSLTLEVKNSEDRTWNCLLAKDKDDYRWLMKTNGTTSAIKSRHD